MAKVTVPSTALPNPGDDMLAQQVRDWTNNIVSFLEGTNIDETNVDLSGTDGIVGKSTAQTITGLKSFERTDAAAAGELEGLRVGLNPASGTPTDNDGVYITLYADDDGGNVVDLVRLSGVFIDTANTSEESSFDISLIEGNETFSKAASFSLIGTAGTLELQNNDTTIVDGDELGRIQFRAPSEASGTDSILVGAAIYAEADDTFSASVNDTDLVFAVAESEAAAERMRLSYDGTAATLLLIGATTMTLSDGSITDSSGAISFGNENLTSTGDITGLTLNATGNVTSGDNAAIGYTASEGLILIGQGSSFDVTIKNDASANVLSIATGTTIARFGGDVHIDNGSGLVVGHSAQLTISDGGGATDLVPEVQVLGTTQADSSALFAAFSTTATRAAAPTIALAKGGAATIAVGTVVTDNEILGSIIAYGDDGTDLEAPAGAIEFAVDGTPGTGDMPGEIKFYTTVDAGEVLTLALTLSAAQMATFAGGITGQYLCIDGTTESTSTTTGSIHTAGGLGVAGDIYAGDDIFFTSGAVLDYDAGDVTWTHAAGKLTLGGDGAVEIDFANHEMTNVDINSGAIDGTAIGAASAAAGSFAAVVGTTAAFSGILSVDNATDATSTTTGSIHTDGGVGIAKDLILGGTSQLFIGDTTNADQTTGITINMGAADNQALTFKSSDVSHGMTGDMEADTWGNISKAQPISGGLAMTGTKDADGNKAGFALHLNGRLGEAADTTDTTTSPAVVALSGQVIDGGSSVANVAATGNAVGLYNGSTLRFLVKGNGALHATNVTSDQLDGTGLDGEDDVGLIRTFERQLHSDVGIMMSRWDEQIEANEADLKRVGVLSSEGHFYNMQRMNSLLGGGIWQNHTCIMELKEALEDKDHRIALLEAQVKGLIH